MTRIALITALGLTGILLSGCGGGVIASERPKASPSSEFLYCVADEYEASTHGQCTKEVIKDWVAQNEPG